MENSFWIKGNSSWVCPLCKIADHDCGKKVVFSCFFQLSWPDFSSPWASSPIWVVVILGKFHIGNAALWMAVKRDRNITIFCSEKWCKRKMTFLLKNWRFKGHMLNFCGDPCRYFLVHFPIQLPHHASQASQASQSQDLNEEAMLRRQGMGEHGKTPHKWPEVVVVHDLFLVFKGLPFGWSKGHSEALASTRWCWYFFNKKSMLEHFMSDFRWLNDVKRIQMLSVKIDVANARK